MSQHKLQIKIGPNEFSAEGAEETVQAQYQQFLEAVRAQPQPRGHVAAPTATKPAADGNGGGPVVLPAALDKVFRIDRNGIVSLRTLPATENRDLDALILLAYGFQKVKDQHDTPAVQLMTGARQSGLSLVRFDRIFAGQTELIRKGGKKKGTRYTLTNPGINHAEGIMAAM